MKVVSIVGLACFVASASYATTLFTASGSAGGNTIDAQAQFSIAGDTLTLTLTNLLSDPGSVGQNLSDFSFQLLAGGVNITPGCNDTAGATDCLTGANAPTAITVANDGTYSTAGTNVDPGWAFSLSSNVFTLDSLTNGPSYTIIGPPDGSNVYGSANSSITGSNGHTGPHNPFVFETATWTFTVPGLTPTTTPAHIVFSFGTTEGAEDFSCDINSCGGRNGIVPEPSTFFLLGSGLVGIGVLSRRRRRKA